MHTLITSLYLLFPFNVLWAHFHEARRLMTRFHWSLLSACKFRLASSSCIFLLLVFLDLPGGCRPGATTCRVFPQDLCLPPSHHMPEPPQPSHPQHIPNSLTPHLLATSALLTWSLHVTPAIYLNILLSQLSNIPSSLAVSAHVSPPYRITDLMHASYTLPRWCSGIPLLTSKIAISFHFPHAAPTLALIALSEPPPHSKTSPR